MKSRMMMLLMSLFTLTPALLGSAWGIENRSRKAEAQECSLMGAKSFETKKKSGATERPVQNGAASATRI